MHQILNIYIYIYIYTSAPNNPPNDLIQILRLEPQQRIRKVLLALPIRVDDAQHGHQLLQRHTPLPSALALTAAMNCRESTCSTRHMSAPRAVTRSKLASTSFCDPQKL
jgi:hypothetical protein